MALLFKSQPNLRIRVQKSVRVRHGAASISQTDQSRNWIFLQETKCRPTSQVGKSDKTNCRWQHLRKRILHLILHMVIKENKSEYLMNASMHCLKNLCSIWKQVTCQKSPTELDWRESKPKKNWDCYHLCWQTLESSWSKNSHSDLPGIKNEEGRIKSSCTPHLKMEIYLESSRTLKNTGVSCILCLMRQLKFFWQMSATRPKGATDPRRIIFLKKYLRQS